MNINEKLTINLPSRCVVGDPIGLINHIKQNFVWAKNIDWEIGNREISAAIEQNCLPSTEIDKLIKCITIFVDLYEKKISLGIESDLNFLTNHW